MLLGHIKIGLATQKAVLAEGLRSMDTVEKLLDDVRLRYKLPDEIFDKLWVVLHEAVTNAICHGNKLDPEKKVVLTVEAKDPSTLSFSVTDEGEGFDPSMIPDPTSPDRIAEPNGRGVFLISKLSDKVIFTEGGRCVNMLFRISPN
jgi:serine/threonine-protein kinase RsbW